MPLFMLLSGYLFFYSVSARELKEVLVRRVQRLMQPIVVGGLFMYLITKVPFYIIEKRYSKIFSGEWFADSTSIWFLWSVLAASLVVVIVYKTVRSVGWQVVLLVLCTPIVALFPNAAMNLFMYPFFVCGFYFAKYKDQMPGWVCKLKYSALVLYPVLFSQFQSKHYIYARAEYARTYSLGDMLIIDGYRYMVGLAGSIFVLVLLELLHKWAVGRTRMPALLVGMEKLGQKSLQIYMLSIPLLSRLLAYLFPIMLNVLGIENIFAKNTLVFNFAFMLPLAVVFAVGLYIAEKMLEFWNVDKILFGR